MGMDPTTPSTTGRGIRTPMGIPPGSLSRRTSLLCWASVAHPMSHISERSGLMGRTAPTALHRSWLRCYGPSLSNLADPPPKSWITTGKSTNAGTRLELLPAGVAVGLACKFWSGFPERYSCLGLGAGLVFCTIGAVFGLLAGWGLFFPTLSWPLVAAGMMVSVGLAGGVVAVSAITSSPTLVIFCGVRESRLSLRSESELSLDSRLFPRLRGVIKSDSMSFSASVGLGGKGGGVLPGSTGSLPSKSSRLPGSSGGRGLLMFLHSLAE